MGDYSLFREGRRAKKHKIILIIILAFAARLFFSVLFDEKALAGKAVSYKKTNLEFPDPLEKIRKKEAAPALELSKTCYNADKEAGEEKGESEEKEKYEKLMKDHPMQAMIPYIIQEEKTVAAFLIGIAKKESNWGVHSPKKDGRDCYNYWGYRGSYNATDSGYSCFDSPEQAVDVVGERIERLIDQKINTPERMIVWKCGSTCAGHDPAGVRKWISDVSLYYNRLNS